MDKIKLVIEQLPHSRDLPLPAYQTEGASGMDLLAAVDTPIVIDPGRVVLVPTGLRLEIPIGYEIQVRARSGLALRNGLFVLNGPGTIDADYRGELQVILANFGELPFRIERGLRIAQIVLAKVERICWDQTRKPAESNRNSGGFGSTGLTG